jgi:MFS family permease
MKHSKAFVFTLLATILFISSYYLLLPVLPLHMQNMGGTKFQIGLIMGIFSASSLLFRPLSGRISDKRGPVKIVKVTVALFFLSPFFYLKDSFLMVSLVQILYGYGVGAFTVCSAMIITESVPAQSLSQAIGIHSIALIVAKGISPTIGTYVFDRWGLYAVVALTVVQSLVALALIFRLEDIPPRGGSETAPFTSVISYRMVWIPSLVLLTVTFTFGNIMTMLPLLALERNIQNYSWFFTANTISTVAIRLFTGKQKFLSQEAIIAISLIFVFIPVCLLSQVNNLPLLILAALIYGLGYGAVYPALSTLVVLNSPVHLRGSAFGFFTAFFDLGFTLGSVWGGFSEYLGFRTVYFLGSFVPLVGLACFLLLLRQDGVWEKIINRKSTAGT